MSTRHTKAFFVFVCEYVCVSACVRVFVRMCVFGVSPPVQYANTTLEIYFIFLRSAACINSNS